MKDRELIELNEALSAEVVDEIRALEGKLIAKATYDVVATAWMHGVCRSTCFLPCAVYLVLGVDLSAVGVLGEQVGVGVVYTLTSPADERKLARYPHAVCFTDGAAATAVRLLKGEGGPQVSQGTVILAANLVVCAARSLRFAGRHAARAGARGDAVVHARVFGPHSLLAFNHTGLTEPYPHAYKVREARSSLTLPIGALAGEPQEAFAATRLMLADLFNAYGCPEVPQIAPDGTLRALYFPPSYDVAKWAEQHDVPTTSEQIAYRR